MNLNLNDPNLMRFFRRGLSLALLAAPCLFLARADGGDLPGNILYNYFDFSNGGAVKLATINSDGTGDQFVTVNLRNPYYPVWSRDGKSVAVAASDLVRPAKLSTDIYVWRPSTGAITKLSAFEDTAGASGFLTFYPSYLAFSPDGQRVAAGMVAYAGARRTTVYTNQFGDPTGPYDTSSHISRCVSLLVFNVNGGSPVLVSSGLCDDDSGDPGEGVDWSPNQDLIAYPYNVPTLFAGPGGAVFPLTTIQVIEPTEGAADQGRRRQLTFPTGAIGQVFDPVSVSYSSDFAPSFSPDGKQVAYVRALTVVLAVGTKLPITPSIRVVNVDGSGDHEVARFEQGSYLTRLSWSSDGKQLVFDLGKQALRQGFPLRSFDVNTVGLAAVRTDGSGFRYVRGVPASWPAWQPGLTTGTVPPALRMSPGTSAAQMILSWPASAGNFVVERANDLGPLANWTAVTDTPVTANGIKSLTLLRSGKQGWFRLGAAP